ncbi:MAG: glycerol-3-phosphate 1-O-acyltransferase [Gammaproteobacteria bacterium]|nr:MAG: glycerol-3-phosphate 1-O-acyltransferase [Gammaproteobacteria bacterium]
MEIVIISLVIASYLFGSISAAIITCKLMGLPDPRTTGSNNPGATNVLRIGGKKAAFITLLGDMLKGTIPVLITQFIIYSELVNFDNPFLVLALTGLAAFIGHLFPLFFKFKGGKGVATALGVLLGWNYILFIVTGATWLIVSIITRYSSLSALVAFLLAPLYVYMITGDRIITAICAVMTILLYWRHSSNILKLIAGEEKKIGQNNKYEEEN